MTRSAGDVLIIGAGAIGAATAFFCAQQGLTVTVLDRGPVGGGTSSRCEGNLLVSDKEHGPELELAQHSLALWRGELSEHADLWEFEAKGGIIVASREASIAALQRVLPIQRQHGVEAYDLDISQLRDLEPWVTGEALGAAFYPEDSQIMPMKAVFHLLRLARDRSTRVLPGTPVLGFLRDGDRVIGVRTPQGDLHASTVINCAGPWAGEVAALAGVSLPIAPRKGFVLVTEPQPPRVHHKVYAAEYIDAVGSSDEALQTSPVVESTPAGSILIGSSRERVGFDTSVNREALSRISRSAVTLFPFLGAVRALRHYHGFRPYSPDHLPVIGPDPRAPGLWHASGHEGAGIGLSAGTGHLLAQALCTGTGDGAPGSTDVPLADFSPHRFETPRRAHDEP